MSRRFFLTVIFSLTAMSGWAEAYLLPSAQVLHKASQTLNKRLGSQVSLEGQLRKAGQGLPVPIQAQWSFSPETHLTVTDESGDRSTWRRGATAQGIHGLLPNGVTRSVMATLFGKGQLRKLIIAHGINPARQRLVLHDSKVAHVIGSDDSSLERPQIWIDQHSFDIVRIITQLQGQTTDIEFKDWSGPISTGRFPHRIVMTVNGRWVQRLELLSFRGNGG